MLDKFSTFTRYLSKLFDSYATYFHCVGLKFVKGRAHMKFYGKLIIHPTALPSYWEICH